jgi:hypothetical protein
MLEALRRMDAVVSCLRSTGSPGWRRRSAEELRAASESIQEHCRLADAPGGLITQVEREVGGSHNVRIAHVAHEQLRGQLDALALLLSQEVHIDVLRERAEEIVEALRQHVELGGDLVYDAVLEPETGVGD